ncbi:DUF3253 domain-containing protein [Primorskyibacter sp. S187A]|uniref:DUF3253 domain-containing protein n=1 Tax=Primorskyibacter sp. S187A TaxID=3415130 RepID=UPI003C7AEBFB
MTPEFCDEDIARVLLDLAHARGPDKSFCPSEGARRLADDWRPLMADVRRVARDTGLMATQKGVEVDPVLAKGPIRLRLRPTGSNV